MEVLIDAGDFKDAMKTFSVIFEGQIDVLMTTSEGCVVLEAGRDGSYVKHLLEASVKTEGSVVVECARFTQIRMKKDSSLHLKTKGKELAFKAGPLQGKMGCKPKMDDIEHQRPLKEFTPKTRIPTQILTEAVKKTAFVSSLPGAMNGVRIQAKDRLVISTTDHYRATLYVDDLVAPQEEIDVLLRSSFIQTLLSRIKEPEVSIGVQKGMFQLATELVTVYHPSIQSEPQDIQNWVENEIDHDAKKCQVQTTIESLVEVIDEASSITDMSFDTHIEVLIKENKMITRVTANHGSAHSSIDLDFSNAEKHLTRLSSKYILEMLKLAKSGGVTVSFWKNFVMLNANSSKFTALLPTIA
tara:strand:+ start:5225 stop:6292 length:1068 start_codon:yes stop_codon:yes gene_type:complete